MIKSDLMSVYVAQFIDDLNHDGIPEILAVHGGDELSDPALEEKMFGRLIIFDGKNGTIIKWMQVSTSCPAKKSLFKDLLQGGMKIMDPPLIQNMAYF